MKSILDPTFRYTRSEKTDLQKTFARIRRQQARAAAEAATDKAAAPAGITVAARTTLDPTAGWPFDPAPPQRESVHDLPEALY